MTHNSGIAIGALCQQANRRRVIVFENDVSRVKNLRTRFNTVISDASNITETVDAAILAPESDADRQGFADTMTAMSAILSQTGCFIVLLPNGTDTTEIIRGPHLHELYRFTIEAHHTSHLVLVLNHDDYDRFAHAQSLADAAHPDWATDLLALAEGDGAEQEIARLIAMHRYLLAGDDLDQGEMRLKRFFTAQSLFAKITAQQPHCTEAFTVQAEFWNRLGNSDMAQHLLRTLQFAQSPAIAETPNEPITHTIEADPQTYDPKFRPRLLVILEPTPDYGSDVLFDGLAEVLGDRNVVDFPWKGSLHGEKPTTQQNYPCMFNRPGTPLTFDEVSQQLSARRFDAVLYCAHTNPLLARDLRDLIAYAPGIPLYIIDQSDSPVDNRQTMAAHIGAPRNVPYFKREMLQCVDYGLHAYPLPFAYPTSRLPSTENQFTIPLFWAGHRQFGMRRLYLEQIETLLGKSFDQQLSQEKYAKKISNARIGLNFFGLGFDTVRYWELPAHGCMLLSPTLPIRIPKNFIHGESAVFFDNLEELQRRLMYYLQRPDEAAHIAHAGRAHLEQHHTGAARAKQLLARIQQLHSHTAND